MGGATHASPLQGVFGNSKSPPTLNGMARSNEDRTLQNLFIVIHLFQLRDYLLLIQTFRQHGQVEEMKAPILRCISKVEKPEESDHMGSIYTSAEDLA
jgi:hypothetical protein